MIEQVVIVQPEVVVTSEHGVQTTALVPDTGTALVVQPEIISVQVDGGPVLHIDAGMPGPPGAPGSGSGGSAGVFVRSVSAAGIVADLVWAVDGKHLEAATTDSEQITLTALVEGGLPAYQPTVTIAGVDAVVTETSTTRIFQAVATVPLAVGETVIDVVASTGGRDSILITRLSGGPAVLDVVVAPPTAPQTHYRSGQTATVAIMTDSDATQVTISASGAAASSVTVPVSGGLATATITISSSASSPITVTAFNSFGTAGDQLTSDNVPIDQTFPTLSLGLMYPAGQYAIEHGEIATLSTAASGHSSVVYDIPASLSASAEYEAFKDLTCATLANELVTSVTVTAHKASNASSTSKSQSVRIANVAPSLSISIDGNPTRLTRSTLGTSYTLRVVASQPLISLAIDGVTMIASTDRMTWTGTIKIYDTTPTGDYLVDVDVVGAAGHAGTGSRTFTVGGFSSRTVTWPAFSRVVGLGFPIYNQANVTCSLGSKVLTRQTDAVDRPNGFYIADANGAYNPWGSYIALSDVAFAASNTSGTLQGTVQEA